MIKVLFLLASALFSVSRGIAIPSPHSPHVHKRSGMETAVHAMEEFSNDDEELAAFLKWGLLNAHLTDGASEHSQSSAQSITSEALEQEIQEIWTKVESRKSRGKKSAAKKSGPVNGKKAAAPVNGKRKDAPVIMIAENQGRKFLEAMGWKEGQGLGKDGQGIQEPVTVPFRLPTDKRGVGFEGPLPPQKRQKGNRFAALGKENDPLDLSIPLSERFRSSGTVGGPEGSVNTFPPASLAAASKGDDLSQVEQFLKSLSISPSSELSSPAAAPAVKGNGVDHRARRW